MLGSEQRIRPASPEDASALRVSLARAFDDDPLVRWVFDRPSRRDACLQRFFGWWFSCLEPQGVTWTAGDGDGAAIWALPGRHAASTTQQLRLAAGVARGVRHPVAAIRGITALEHAHPDEPHLYLAVLGVDPARQGEGLGGALLRPGLDLCDDDRLPAYLETAKARNVDFYTRFGFRVLSEERMPRGGPPVWRMWREPR